MAAAPGRRADGSSRAPPHVREGSVARVWVDANAARDAAGNRCPQSYVLEVLYDESAPADREVTLTSEDIASCRP